MRPTPRPRPLAALCALALAAACATTREEPAPAPATRPRAAAKELPTRGDLTADMEALPGLLPAWWDADGGKLYLSVRPGDADLLHVVSLPAGLGSNRVGLDRGQLGDKRVVRFVRAGGRVLLVQPNLDWRTSSDDPVARAAVRDAFAQSVLWSFEPVARDGDRLVVDATGFLLTDWHGAARRIAQAGQGKVALDAARSCVWREGCAGFPENTELEALLTFSADEPGRELRATAADPRAVSLRVRHSFVALPPLDGSFRPRRDDPRSGFFSVAWRDVGAAIDAPQLRRLVARHRLDAEHPIVYYVDRAAPEPVRTALLEGARYWEPVFAAAGFPGGFRAELLPEGADPHDVRYDVVQWVNRSTRGWSYGDTVTDPRTGEILKGHVTLGALRVRQDVLLAEGLLSPYADGRASDARVTDMALARIRQLAAHEIGHTLGLRHNFAASASGRASVMDYPAPRVTIAADGTLDLSDAYRDGCGAWDELAIRYGYADFGADEEAGLAAVLAEMAASGIAYATDADARGNDRAHPLANLWDDGADPVESLRHELEVRRIALERFGPGAIKPGEPLADLELALLPVYFHHRYQLEAAVRQLGGVAYAHAVRAGDAEPVVAPVAPEAQRAALELAFETLRPGFLALPERVLALIPPPPPGADGFAERFDDGALLLDPGTAAASCVRMTLDLLLDPARAARLVDQKARDEEQVGLVEVLDRLVRFAWTDPRHVHAELRAQTLRHLARLARDEDVALPVRTSARASLAGIERYLEAPKAPPASPEELQQEAWELDFLRHLREDPRAPELYEHEPELPPGSPIGCGFGMD